LDTSNYTTSAALFDGTDILQKKKMLPVKPGELGLRQSDALFHHTAQLPELLEELLPRAGGIAAIGVSDRPRALEGSYMPCFLAGLSAARALAAALRVPLFRFSHQQGHLAAALFSARRTDLLSGKFLAFHVSGGTTECLLVRPNLQAESIGGTADLKAGQLLDRVGVALGFSFPAGAALDRLAQTGVLSREIKVSAQGAHCHLSGLENQCRRMIEQAAPPEDIARFCVESIAAALLRVTEAALRQCGALPLLFAGGVCCSEVLRRRVRAQYPEAMFAAPAFSADNAAGAALLAFRELGILKLGENT
jgi:N6-L-threonylcarbamoyladenine synthase